MIIRTTQDLELINCCGCDFPSTEEPRKECESVEAEGYLYGFISFVGDTSRWKATRQSYADGGWMLYTYDNNYRIWVNSVEITDAPNVTITNNGGPYTGALTTTYEDEITPAVGRAAILAIIDAEITEEDYVSGSCASPYLETIASGTLNPGIELMRTRYRIGIPVDYDRSTFETQWDEVFFPQDWLDWEADYNAYVADKAAWDACELETPGDCGAEPTFTDPEPTPGPSLVTSRSWNYTGASEWSDWFELTVPESDGETRVVNMLSLGWKSSRIGQKPTAHGEIIEI